MKLTLEGFRTYSQKTVFEFDEQGYVLIEGQSGKGKSTLFRAIHWALYGKDKSPYTWNGSKKKCSVILEIQNKVIIHRQKNPERLTVTLKDQTPMNGEEAQAWILNAWGTRESWLATSCLMQNARNLLISGTANEKIQLLAEWCFGDDNPGKYLEQWSTYKQKEQQQFEHYYKLWKSVKETVMDPPEELSKNRQEYTLSNQNQASKELKKHEELWEQLLQKDQKHLLLKEVNESIQDIEEHISQLQGQLWTSENLCQYEQTTQQLIKYQDLEKEITNLTTPKLMELVESKPTWTQLLEQINNYYSLSQDMKKIQVHGYDELIKELEKVKHQEKIYPIVQEYNLLNYITHEDIRQYSIDEIIQAQNHEQKHQEVMKILTKLKIKPEELPSIQEKLKKYNVKIISVYKQWKELSEQYDEPEETPEEAVLRLKNMLKELEQKYTSGKQSLDVHTCPHCQGYLRMIQNKLVVSNTPPVTQVQLTKWSKQLEETKNRLKIVEQIIDLTRQLEDQDPEVLEDLLQFPWVPHKDLILSLTWTEKPCPDSKTMKSMNDHIKKQELESKLTEEDKSLDKTLNTIINQKILMEQCVQKWVEPCQWTLDEIKKGQKLSELISEYNNLKNKIKNEVQDLKLRKETAQEQHQLKGQLIQYQQQLSQQTGKYKQLEKWIQTVQSVSIEDIKVSIENLRIFLDECAIMIPWNEKQSTLQKYEQSYKEFEKKMTQWSQIIEKAKLLEHTLLEQFLTTLNTLLEDVMGKLFDDPIHLAFELFKGDRPSVQLSLLYKGGQGEALTELSGGELDRISLAVTTALSVTGSYPYLLLDECFGSLDADTRERCLTAIKELLPHKAVYIIAHGETVGDYTSNHLIG